MSGDTANFLAGGEFPIPVSRQTLRHFSSHLTVEFKQFGISLAFTPTILQDGMINMSFNPEVSSMDPTTSVQLGDIFHPGIKVRAPIPPWNCGTGSHSRSQVCCRTTIKNNIRISIPGAICRSSAPYSVRRDISRIKTELVIIVTPHLVTPRRGFNATPAIPLCRLPTSTVFVRITAAKRKT